MKLCSAQDGVNTNSKNMDVDVKMNITGCETAGDIQVEQGKETSEQAYTFNRVFLSCNWDAWRLSMH